MNLPILVMPEICRNFQTRHFIFVMVLKLGERSVSFTDMCPPIMLNTNIIHGLQWLSIYSSEADN